MRIRSIIAVSSFALVLQLSDAAHAGPVEQLVQLAQHPTQPDVMVLRYRDGGDGLFYSRDGGKSWALQCLSAMAGINKAGPIAVAGSGQLLMGAVEGLYHDDGRGCGWSQVSDLWIGDIVPHPSDPGVMFAVTTRGGMGVRNGILKHGEGGKVTDFGPKEELMISRMRVVQSGSKLRFYQSVLKGTVKRVVDGVEVDSPNYIVRYSEDDAQTFTEFPFVTPAGSLRLQAVDPSNPDRVVAVLEQNTKDDEILISSDRGEHFKSYLMVSEFGGLAFNAAGKVFIGEAGVSDKPDIARALWVADNLDSPPTKLADYPVQCLAYQASSDTVFACQYRLFGTVDQQSGAFTKTLSFGEVEDFLSCDGKQTDMACKEQLCADYCTYGHFPQAPLCDVYTGPNCGPCVAKVQRGEPLTPECDETPGGTATAGRAASAGTSSGGGSTSSSAGGSAVGSAGSSASAAATSGSGAGDDDHGSDSGCACSSAGQQRPDAAPSAVFATLGLLLVGRRRRAGSRRQV